jgi:hypothetical protein
MTTTFSLTVFAWIFFRAENMGHALSYISGIFSTSLLMTPEIKPSDKMIGLIVLFFIIEWFGRGQQHALARLCYNLPRPIRWAVYYYLIFAIFIYVEKQQQFIYFQF